MCVSDGPGITEPVCLQNFPQFARLLAAFAGVAIPAAVVNSGLKYMQKRIQIAFQRRLSHHLHQQYCSNRAYYAASTLGGLTNADQRITEDVEKFAYNISELYSYTFKVCSYHRSHVEKDIWVSSQSKHLAEPHFAQAVPHDLL